MPTPSAKVLPNLGEAARYPSLRCPKIGYIIGSQRRRCPASIALRHPQRSIAVAQSQVVDLDQEQRRIEAPSAFVAVATIDALRSLGITCCPVAVCVMKRVIAFRSSCSQRLTDALRNPVVRFADDNPMSRDFADRSLNVVDILQACPLFAEVGPSSFQRLAAMARLVFFHPGQSIFREGQEAPGVFVVGSGMVRIFKTGPNGREHVLHMVGPRGTFAELAVIGKFAVPASAEAVSETCCTLLPTSAFRQALDEDHDLCREMLTGVTVWFRHFVGLVEDIVLRDAAGRLARYLLKIAEENTDTVELPSLKRHVASHLNLTSEAFSRTLRRLIDSELIIEFGDNRIRLLDRRGLELVAEGMFPRV